MTHLKCITDILFIIALMILIVFVATIITWIAVDILGIVTALSEVVFHKWVCR